VKIGIAFDLAPAASPSGPAEGPDDRFEEFDKPETVEAIAAAIRGDGHDVVLLGDGRDFLTRVLADPPDFVFNIAEGEGVGRCREARVPAALEMLGIPYSGSDPLTLALCLDKGMAKRLVDTSPHVTVPRGWSFPPQEDRWVAEGFFQSYFDRSGRSRHNPPGAAPASAILKPEFEGSSKGIRGQAVANDADEALAILDQLHRDYGQPVLVEDYIDGDEVTVGFVGRRPIGAMRIVPKRAEAQFVYSLEVKRDWRNRVTYEAPPRLSDLTIIKVVDMADQIYHGLGCRDLARIDFRVRDGVPYFIEANPLPGLAPVTSDLVIMAEGYGIGHAELIRKILHAALTRVGLK